MTSYYASDIIESSLRLAGIQTLNNLSWKDACSLLNEKYSQTYQAITNKDPSLYSKIIKVDRPIIEMRRDCVLRPVDIFISESPILSERYYFKPLSNYSGVTSKLSYRRQGDTILLQGWPYQLPVWFEYVPQPLSLTYISNNRNPKQINNYTPVQQSTQSFDIWEIRKTQNNYIFHSLNNMTPDIDLNLLIERPDTEIINVVADWPYCWITVRDLITNKYRVYLYDGLPDSVHCSDYDPFAYKGIKSNLIVWEAKYDDYTGGYAIVEDRNKYNSSTGTSYYFEVGCYPDTKIDFPLLTPYNMLIAQVANRLAMLNGEVREAVQEAMAAAASEFNNMVVPEISGWQSIKQVKPNGGYIGGALERL